MRERSDLYLPYFFSSSVSILPPGYGQGLPCLDQDVINSGR